ncbi:chlorogenic acid esterase precursor [Paramyrothecium foliicola]|nr:chlorogenic acid esterase precursor [Paramyrothecium foliicola]
MTKYVTSIPPSALSNTFKDAMYTALELGIMYIWIDSLCIMQDSAEDWMHESKRMGDVYSHAECNIAATGHRNGTFGLFSERNALPLAHFPLLVNLSLVDEDGEGTQFDGFFVRGDDYDFVNSVDRSVLNSRAWVAQERALSPGIIHFTPEKIWWECKELIANEAYVMGDLVWGNDVRRAGTIHSLKGKDKNEIYAFRRNFVSHYASTEVTRAEDRFPAVLGMARSMEEVLNEDFIAGFWKENLQTTRTVLSKLLEIDGNGQALPSHQVRDEGMGTSLTTANTLAYLIWAVCRHPRVKGQLIEELRSLPNGFTNKDLQALPFLELVILETLRLYPAAPDSLPQSVPPGGAEIAGIWLPADLLVTAKLSQRQSLLMMLLINILLHVLATSIVLAQSFGDLTVRTSTGAFTGLIDPEFPLTRQWRAIPFAEPPVGSRRWLPPQKISRNSKHRYSTKFPASCPQFVSAAESMWNLPLTKGNLIYNGAQNDSSGLVGEATSEDCLYLAIWAPAAAQIPKQGLPVLFFMTGGGFTIGGIELPWQIPTSWVERSQSHIVVSINYRLNIFGFPHARGLSEQNIGILDQRAALEWVRDNIKAFGGDPSRIMQWGRSAGSSATDIHAYAFHQDPIAQSYYMESGTVFSTNPVKPDSTFSNFTFVARHVGCENPCGSKCKDEEEFGAAELDCMRQVSMIQITNFVGQYADRAENPPLRFGITIDEHVVFSDYHARSQAGKFAHRPIMLSFTANEFASLVPWPKDNLEKGPDQAFLDAWTVPFWVCAVFNSTTYRNRAGVPVFRFQYASEFPNLNVYEWLGAYHNAETPLVFGTYGLLDHIADTTKFQIEVSHSMQDRLLAFAKDPFNGPQKLSWTPSIVSEPNGGKYLRFGGSSGKAWEIVDGIEIDGACLGERRYNAFP